MQNAVFYDPQQRRWRRVRMFFDFVGALITIVVIVFVVDAVLRSESLPNVLLPVAHKPYRALHDKEKNSHRIRHLKHKPVHAKNAGAVGVTGESPRAAFYVVWDAGSFSSLREYYPHIDWLYPEWLHVLTPDGRIQGVTIDNEFFNIVQGDRVHPPDDKVMPFLKSEKAQTKVFPLVNNFEPVSRTWLTSVGDFLKNPAGRDNFRRQIQALMQSDSYGGLTLDFEEIPEDAQPSYRQLVTELCNDLHARGLKLFINVPVENVDFDFAFFSAHTDGLILMDYDEHFAEGAPGAIASQAWFVKNLQSALKVVPKDKLIVAIGNYGYEWRTEVTGKGRKRKEQRLNVDAVTVQEAWIRAAESDEGITFDPDSLNPHLAFMDDQSIRHDVWFLDAVTALNEMRAANQLGVDRFALWRLGSEDRSLWNVWDAPSEAGATGRLREVLPGQDVDLEGEGEILKVQSSPSSGTRTLTVDRDTGIVTDEDLPSLPQPYVVQQYGASAKQVALSFDDGPDATYTPKILDVLKAEKAPATFFLIGSQAEKFSSITRRIYDEGHEIGNHTFTHPDISNVGKRYIDLELNLTERFFAGELGVKPVFFRPPYSIDQEPDTADQVRPLEDIEKRGYILVGDKIDPNDWKNDPRPTPDQITSSVMAQLKERPGCAGIPCGNIVLLHDGGGDRTATVKALPGIIHSLRAAGYEIVPISTLIGKTRDNVMPAISPNERFTARIDDLAFTLFGTFNAFIVFIFFIGDFLMTGRLALVGFLAVFDRLRSPRTVPARQEDYRPSVAILVPAYNEEKVIARTLRSALASDYPNVRVIVVDDGSTDRTSEIVRETFSGELSSGRLLLLREPNAGKAHAANFGLQYVTEEIFVAVDADTLIAPDAVSYLVPNFSDLRIGAVAGNAKVGNRVNMWTRWQALEYITSQNFERRALDALGAVSVVPGAIGAWRTACVREVGSYQYDTVAEDADLTMSLLQHGYRVQYEDRALAFTEAPMTPGGLMRQRFRWSFGILQAVWKHRKAFLRGGVLGWVALPNIVIFQIMLPLVSPLIDLMFLFGALSYFLDRHYHPDTANPANFEKLMFFFALFLVIDFVASAIAFLLERPVARHSNDKWLLLQVWLQRFAYRQLFSLVLVKTLKRAFDGRPFSWDKLDRSANVSPSRAEAAN